MTREKLKTAFIVATLTFMGIMCLPGVNTWGKEGHGKEEQYHQDETGLAEVHLTQLPAVLQALKAAEKAIQSNDKDAALSALKDAKKQLWAVKKITGKQIQPLIINSLCPISGDEIKVTKLTAKTVRPYEGKFIAFCCLDCGPQWDKLSDKEKETKLSKVSSKSIWTCSMHPQILKSKPGKCPLCSMALIPAAKSHDQGSHDDHSGHNH